MITDLTAYGARLDLNISDISIENPSWSGRMVNDYFYKQLAIDEIIKEMLDSQGGGDGEVVEASPSAMVALSPVSAEPVQDEATILALSSRVSELELDLASLKKVVEGLVKGTE